MGLWQSSDKPSADAPSPLCPPSPHTHTSKQPPAAKSSVMDKRQGKPLIRNPTPHARSREGLGPTAHAEGLEERLDAPTAMQSEFKYQYLPSKVLSDGRAIQTCNCPAMWPCPLCKSSLQLWGRVISPGTPASPALLMYLLSLFHSQLYSPYTCQADNI